MIGNIMIDYEPGPNALPTILGAVAEAGFVVRGLRVTPGLDPRRATLSLELDGCTEPIDLAKVEHHIMASGAALAVVHRSAPVRAPLHAASAPPPGTS